MASCSANMMTASDEPKGRRTAFVVTVLIGSAIGIVWNVLAALVLFRSYSFFESVVVCLLVMILSAIGTMRADFEPGGLLERRAKSEEDPIRDSRSLVKGIFYTIAFVMAIVKLVLALIAAS